MKYLILLITIFSFNNIYASCFNQDEESVCRYPQGDDWCVSNKHKSIYSYRDKCDFFENSGPEYSNDASGSGAYEVYITRLSPYNVNVLKNGHSIVSAKLKESYDFKIGVASVECHGKEYVTLTNNGNEIIDESFLPSYVKSNKKSVGSFMCKEYFAIKNHRSIKDHFQDSAPLFRDFKVTDMYGGKNHKLFLDSFSKQFSSELNEYIEAGKVNFAEKYIAANWSCKPIGCSTGAVIDATTGKVYPFPAKINIIWPVKAEFKDMNSKELLYKLNSRLMIFAGNVETTKRNYPDSVLFYEFTGKEFKLLKVLPYGKAITPNEAEESELAPQTKVEPPKPTKVAKLEPVTTPPKNAEITKTEKPEPIEKSASGSISLTFLASFLGLLVWRTS